jgi:hypothetical protein
MIKHSFCIGIILVAAMTGAEEAPVSIQPPDATYCINGDPIEFIVISTHDRALIGYCFVLVPTEKGGWAEGFPGNEFEHPHHCFPKVELAPLSEVNLTWPEQNHGFDVAESEYRLGCNFTDAEIAAAKEQKEYEAKIKALEEQIKEIEELGDVEEADRIRDFLNEMKKPKPEGESPPPTPTPCPTATPIPELVGLPATVYSEPFTAIRCQ